MQTEHPSPRKPLRINYLSAPDILQQTLQNLILEGKDVCNYQEEWQRSEEEIPSKNEEKADKLLARIEEEFNEYFLKLQEESGYGYLIKNGEKSAPYLPSSRVGKSDLEDKILGGWQGRAAGCLLGKPVEKIPRHGIRQLLQSNHTWPLDNYITGIGIPAELLGKYRWNRHYGRESLRENIVCMPEDDDLNYTMINLAVAEQFGLNFTPEDILTTWLERLPVLSTFTAERVAYLNALQGRRTPETAFRRNPYNEWIGAQIRADLWGWAAGGDVQLAAGLAWRDAAVSHARNGMYGEIFFAAVLTQCLISDNIKDILHNALAVVPEKSDFTDAIRFAMDLPQRASQWEDALDLLYAEFGRYHWVHVLNNAALVCAALLYGELDYEKTICYAVMGGWDTDCNGATSGSIIGTILGSKRLPAKWIDPLQDTIRSSLFGFDRSSIRGLANRTVRLLSMNNNRNIR